MDVQHKYVSMHVDAL